MAVATFSPGFRVSIADLGVLALGATAATGAALIDASWSLAIALPVAHFFLFCNVFRVSRPLELAWAAVFLALAAPTVAFGAPGWVATVTMSGGTAVAIVIAEMSRPSYHGVFWQRINPELLEWWSQHRLQVKSSKAAAC